jgi:hypothetical protein
VLMKFSGCIAMVVLAFVVATANVDAAQGRHMLAMGDESILFARGSLRREEETD